MLDNLKDQESSPFFQDDEDEQQDFSDLDALAKITRKLSGTILGMKPQQLFTLLIMLLVVICLLGTMFLLVTGKIVAPFI